MRQDYYSGRRETERKYVMGQVLNSYKNSLRRNDDNENADRGG